MPFDLMQVVLVLTIVILTAILTVLGIEVFYILRDVRKLIDRAQNLVGDAEHVVRNVKKPTEVIASIAQSAEFVTKLFDVVKRHETVAKEPEVRQAVDQPIFESQPEGHSAEKSYSDVYTELDQPKPMSLGRRFFRTPRRPVS